MPLLWVIFGFFLYIYAEISLLISAGSAIGVLPLIMLMLAISVVGLWVVKSRGFFTMWQIKSQLSEGKIPTQAVISSVFLAIAGILLMIPGFLSDILAILLMLPISRKLSEKMVIKLFSNRFSHFSFHHSGYSAQQHSQGTTFDAEFERKQDEDKRIH